MKRFSLPFMLLVFTVLLNACKGDKDDPKTKGSLIENKKWVLTASVSDKPFELNNGTVSTDVYRYVIDDCSKDDYYMYEKGGKFFIDEGSDRCGKDQRFPGTWSLSADEKTLTIVQDKNYTYEVIELTDRKLVLFTRGSQLNFTHTYEAR
jgi:hypothetical protein